MYDKSTLIKAYCLMNNLDEQKFREELKAEGERKRPDLVEQMIESTDWYKEWAPKLTQLAQMFMPPTVIKVREDTHITPEEVREMIAEAPVVVAPEPAPTPKETHAEGEDITSLGQAYIKQRISWPFFDKHPQVTARDVLDLIKGDQTVDERKSLNNITLVLKAMVDEGRLTREEVPVNEGGRGRRWAWQYSVKRETVPVDNMKARAAIQAKQDRRYQGRPKKVPEGFQLNRRDDIGYNTGETHTTLTDRVFTEVMPKNMLTQDNPQRRTMISTALKTREKDNVNLAEVARQIGITSGDRYGMDSIQTAIRYAFDEFVDLGIMKQSGVSYYLTYENGVARLHGCE